MLRFKSKMDKKIPQLIKIGVNDPFKRTAQPAMEF